MLAAPIAFAAYNVIVKPLLERHGAVPVTAAAALVGTVALAAVRKRRRPSGVCPHLHAGGIALLLYLGVVATLGGYLGWTSGCAGWTRRGRRPTCTVCRWWRS